jgi:protein-S-isoprenylcysteine O-methyltransferase Ste14
MSMGRDQEQGTGLSDEPGLTTPAPTEPAPRERRRAERREAREVRRSIFEDLLVRLVATCGVVGIGVAIAAVMSSNNSSGWIIGLVVSLVSVVLAGILWSSRRL